MEPEDLIVGRNQIALEGFVSTSEWGVMMEPGEGFTPRQVRGALSRMSGDIDVFVDSRGGHPEAGESIRVVLDSYPGRTRVIVTGIAASAASMLIMGADRIEMSSGSLMMIHDPSNIAMGTAADMRREAAALDVIADTYAGVYAARAGITAEEARAIMLAETWYGPEAAVEAGFADAVFAARSDAVPAMIAPKLRAQVDPAAARASVAAMCRGEFPRRKAGEGGLAAPEPQAVMAATGGPTMEPEDNAVDTATPGAAADQATPSRDRATDRAGDRTAAAPPPRMNVAPPADRQPDTAAILAAERDRARRIMTAARPHMEAGAFDDSFVDGLISAGVSYEAASAQMLERLSTAQPDIRMASRARQTAVIGRDERETRREGLSLALSARIGGDPSDDDRAQPYMGMSLHEMAAAALGRSAPGFGSFDSRERLLMDAFHTTSDFPNILSTSVNRILERQYETVERTFTAISRPMMFNDFRTHDVVRPDEFPTLTQINETGEIKFGSIGDSKETLTLASYGTGLSVSRQALVNDDMGAIQDVLDAAAAIVPEFEESTFWTVFLANGALADTVAMFHGDHGNLAGTPAAITVAALNLGRAALRTMKAADGVRTIMMNGPSILLVGPAKETEAEQFVAQNILPTKGSDVNPFAGKLRVVVSEAITGNQWYLMVDPSKRTCNMRHGYLRDRSMPRVRVAEPFGQQGLKMTLEHDFGVGGVNYRGGYKNAGA